MDFRGKDHEKLFEREQWYRPMSSRRFAAALYLLTADNRLWRQVQDAVGIRNVDAEKMHPRDLQANAYVFFRLARDMIIGTNSVSLSELVSPAVLSKNDFLVICTALAIRGYGLHGAEEMIAGQGGA